MLYKVIDKKQKKEITHLEIDGKEDQFNLDMIFPADRFVFLPVNVGSNFSPNFAR
jgi:hypothetical protein